MFSQVPVHLATLLGFSICLGGGGAGGGDAWRLAAGFFAVGFFGGAAGTRSSVAPLLMFVMRRAGAFLAAGLREGHWGGAPPPLLPPYMLAALKSNFAHRSLSVRSGAFLGKWIASLPQLVNHISFCQSCANSWQQLWPKNGLRRRGFNC